MPLHPQAETAGALGAWASDIVCPACHSEVRMGAADVTCCACGRKYPIVDGIPVLIPDRGERSENS